MSLRSQKDPKVGLKMTISPEGNFTDNSFEIFYRRYKAYKRNINWKEISENMKMQQSSQSTIIIDKNGKEISVQDVITLKGTLPNKTLISKLVIFLLINIE